LAVIFAACSNGLSGEALKDKKESERMKSEISVFSFLNSALYGHETFQQPAGER
jgi:hypothetical protein